MEFTQYADLALRGLIGLFVMAGYNTIRGIKKSIDQLNIQMAVVITKSADTDVFKEKIEERVRKLETKRRG